MLSSFQTSQSVRIIYEKRGKHNIYIYIYINNCRYSPEPYITRSERIWYLPTVGTICNMTVNESIIDEMILKTFSPLVCTDVRIKVKKVVENVDAARKFHEKE